MRAICIREDKWICYKYNINQCSKTEMSYWKLNCSYFRFDMLVKALESVKMVVSPFLSDIIEKYNCFLKKKARPDRREAHSQKAEWSLCGGVYSENGALSQRSTRLSLQYIYIYI